MRVTIIKDDNTVYVDGVAVSIDCSALPPDFHALQWDSASGTGEIEHEAIDGKRKPNLAIDSLGPYQVFLDTWRANAPSQPPAPPVPAPAPRPLIGPFA
jgi:hypothetical protein